MSNLISLVYCYVFSFRYSSVASFISTDWPQYDKNYMDEILLQKMHVIEKRMLEISIDILISSHTLWICLSSLGEASYVNSWVGLDCSHKLHCTTRVATHFVNISSKFLKYLCIFIKWVENSHNLHSLVDHHDHIWITWVVENSSSLLDFFWLRELVHYTVT
jgi:hypothetical protein